MKVIGLTGGIGSGKSTLSHLMQIMGIPVYIADTESKRLTESSAIIREKLTERFGEDLYVKGTLNKTLLASLIFENETNRQYVNSIIHPIVYADFEKWKAQQISPSFVVIETAILFESGFADSVDLSVTVSASEDLRIRRIALRESWSQESIVARIHSQLPEEERIRHSDFVIYNDDKQALIPQMEKLLYQVSML